MIKDKGHVKSFLIGQNENIDESDIIDGHIIQKHEYQRKYNKETKYNKRSFYYNTFSFMSWDYRTIETYDKFDEELYEDINYFD